MDLLLGQYRAKPCFREGVTTNSRVQVNSKQVPIQKEIDMSKSHRLAWAAGFIDGDGFISIQDRNSRINGKQYKGYYLRLGACQANLAPLKELQSLFGGSIRVKNSGPNKEGYNRKEQWVWTLSTNAVKEALLQIIPFMIHKKEVAQLALDFQATMGTTKQVSEDTKTYRALLQMKIKAINSRD